MNSESPTSSAVDADEFKALFRDHPLGVAVITTGPATRPHGFTATSVVSVSAAPPVFVFSVTTGSTSSAAVREADSVVVNFLEADAAALARRFAVRGVDRFEGTAWHALPTGEPVLDGAARWARGDIVERIVLGDSTLVVVLVRETGVRSEPGEPLVYHARRFHRLGEHSATDA